MGALTTILGFMFMAIVIEVVADTGDAPRLLLDGDVVIGGLFDLHNDTFIADDSLARGPIEETCIGFSWEGFLLSQAMVYTIQEINERRDILPNLTLGYDLRDICSSTSHSLMMTYELVVANDVSVSVVVGASGSDTTMAVAEFLSVYNIPIISYDATTSLLDDQLRYKSFLRTVPSDIHQAIAMAELVAHFNWEWIGIIHLDNFYGRPATTEFRQQIENRGLCVAFHEAMPVGATDDVIAAIVDSIADNPSAKIIATFLYSDDARRIIREVTRRNLTDRIFLASEAWAMSTNIANSRQEGEAVEGTLGIEFTNKKIPGFSDYLANLNPIHTKMDNPWLDYAWENAFDCKMPTTVMEDVFSNQMVDIAMGVMETNSKATATADIDDYETILVPGSGNVVTNVDGTSDKRGFETDDTRPMNEEKATITDRDASITRPEYGDRNVITKVINDRKTSTTVSTSMKTETSYFASTSPVLSTPTTSTHPVMHSVHSLPTTKHSTTDFPLPWATSLKSRKPLSTNPTITDSYHPPSNPKTANSPPTNPAITDSYHPPTNPKTINLSQSPTHPVTSDAYIPPTDSPTSQTLLLPTNPVTTYPTLSVTNHQTEHTSSPPLTPTVYCTGDESLLSSQAKHVEETSVYLYRVYLAIYAIAHALHDMLECTAPNGLLSDGICPDIHSLESWQLLRYLRDVNFTDKHGYLVHFDKNGGVAGIYDVINWNLITEDATKRSECGDDDNSGCQADNDVNPNIDVTIVGRYNSDQHPSERLVMVNNVTWKNSSSQVPISQCSSSCQAGQRKGIVPGFPSCCYECVDCPEGSMSNDTDSTECITCNEGTWSNEDRTECTNKYLEYLAWNDPTAIVCITLIIVGLAGNLAVIAIFIYYRDTPVVKGSNRELSFLMLVGLGFCFCSSFTVIGHPTNALCLLQVPLRSVSFTMCVSILLVKTHRIMTVFESKIPNAHQYRCLAKTKLQMLTVLALTAGQVFICVTWLTVLPPLPIYNQNTSKKVIFVECDMNFSVPMVVMFCYTWIIAGFCLLFAFKTRKLPENFNESKYITFSMFIYFLSWLIYFPAYFGTNGRFKALCQVILLLTSSFALLVGIYFPKCHIMLFSPHLNTAMHVRRATLFHADRRTSALMEYQRRLGSQCNDFESHNSSLRIHRGSISDTLDTTKKVPNSEIVSPTSVRLTFADDKNGCSMIHESCNEDNSTDGGFHGDEKILIGGNKQTLSLTNVIAGARRSLNSKQKVNEHCQSANEDNAHTNNAYVCDDVKTSERGIHEADTENTEQIKTNESLFICNHSTHQRTIAEEIGGDKNKTLNAKTPSDEQDFHIQKNKGIKRFNDQSGDDDSVSTNDVTAELQNCIITVKAHV
ncbi:extracellular calcium-sensing receptor-like [Glandiceps talaboti]